MAVAVHIFIRTATPVSASIPTTVAIALVSPIITIIPVNIITAVPVAVTIVIAVTSIVAVIVAIVITAHNGRSYSERDRRYIHWGLKRRTNAQAREEYIREVNPLIEKLGLTVPDPLKDRQYL
jgi:hypothetical protein